ncbi:MAG: F0F1 ATP synthase subunit B [Gammaproteobacteria bacterium]|nr:F0F1 ATP synthase subunit B [Gammaproteobacteria bacterium]
MNFNATLIGQTFAFVVFVWFTMKFVWPLLLKQMHDRETRIADGLAAADKGQKALEEAEIRHTELVDEGKQQAVEIISQAQRRGDEIVEESKSTAKSEGQRLIQAAEAEIERDKTQAREDLRQEVATLALAGVEQILMREVDRNAHNEIITKISSEL